MHLADELRRSSDDLTRMARSFVATLDPRYELYFQTILGIRAGEIAYPANYDDIYWDFVVSENAEIDSSGRTVSIEDRMIELGFSDLELAKIKEAEDLSNSLALIEAEAMGAAKGLYANDAGSYLVPGALNQQLGLDLLFGEQYNSTKGRIMLPIQEFLDLLELRTLKELTEIRDEHQFLISSTITATFLSLLLILLGYFSLNSKIIKPLQELRLAMRRYSSTGEISNFLLSTSKDELGLAANSFYDLTLEIDSQLKEIKNISATAVDAIITTNSDSKILSWNAAATTIFGYEEDVVGQNLDLIISTDEMNHSDDTNSTVELFAKRRYGDAFPIELSKSKWEGRDGIVFCVIARDVTKRKEVEEELRIALDSAEDATKAKDLFLASMSHEIRTPMNGVVGMVDLLMQTEMDSEQRGMLNTVKDSGDSLIQIINEILDYSKIEAGKLELEFVDTNLVDLVESAAKTLTLNAFKKDNHIVTFVDSNIPNLLRLDPVRIRQILINLTSNAIKFSNNSKVLIDVELVDTKLNGVTIRFAISDEGIGISDKAQTQLFQEFTQADTSTTRKYGGTGLGLAICKRLTEMMDGAIGVKSVIGEGSTFFCEIPFQVVDSSQEERKSATDVVKNLEGVSVLLLDFGNDYGEICTRYLSYWGADVVAADSIIECVDLTLQRKEKPFDMILLPEKGNPLQIQALRKAFDAAGHMPCPRLIVGEDPLDKDDRLRDIVDLTLFNIHPMQRANLVTAVAIAVGRASPDVEHIPVTRKIRGGRAPTSDEALAQGKLILLAEDNLTNQDVIRRQLSMLGYACDIANDGKEAFEMWKGKSYATLLTDCHMPEWDGYELTAAIRKEEESTGKRMPIIAITANALRGEAERCIAGGMDAFLSKPVDMKVLLETLVNWLGEGGKEVKPTETEGSIGGGGSPESSAVINANAFIDERVLKDLFGDDQETFKEILQDFIAPARSAIVEIQSAYEVKSAQGVNQASHKLKSAAFSVGAMELGELCKALEEAGRQSDWTVIDSGVPKIDGLMSDVELYISQV